MVKQAVGYNKEGAGLLVSELIKELQDVLKDHGDVNIKIINNEGEAVEIEDIGYHQDTCPVNQEKYLYFSS
ncbi:MAG: hypothetical protein KZQ81_17275 [Candidatus Thiodiazotropha sp. (ex Rostrolucina anterorostrata)]|nr:hypothetical protein [Candidatus Thiodiazotropha sp. (ex Rostrolucina anterorostrata)]